MKKRTSRVSRRIVSLLMSMVLTLTLVTPAAFAEGDMPDNGQQQEQQVPTDAGNGGSGTPIVEGGANPDDVNASGDTEGDNSENKNTEDGKGEQQPADTGDENKNPGEGDGDDANKPAEDNKGEENPDGDKKDEENKDEQPTEERPMRSTRWRSKVLLL